MLSPQKTDHYRSIIEQQLSETLRALEMGDATDAGIVQLDQTRVGRLSRMDAMMTDLSFSEDGCTAYLAILFLDLNGFKSVNDTAGHEADEGADVAPVRRC